MPTIKITPEQAGTRLDVLLTTLVDTTRSQIQKLIKNGSITVNNKPAKTKTPVEPGDEVFYPELNTGPVQKTEPTPILDVVFENDDLLVINKPAGLLVHEAFKDEHRATVVDGLLERHPEVAEVGDDASRPGIVHRLDKDVSGLMVIAKTQEAFDHLKSQFQNRTVTKEYLTLVYGETPHDVDTIDFKISRSKAKGRMVARTGEQEGKEAITNYEVIERLATATYLRVNILTGRTHQIRVHFQAIGHPLVGDKLYKIKKMKYREIKLDRVFLHAHKLSFTLLDGTEQTCTSPLPTELDMLMQKLPRV